MQCPRCQRENRPDAKFCDGCGSPTDPSQRSYAELACSLNEGLEQQRATSEILRVISNSPNDVQPVFGAIAHAATTLCEADLSGLYPFDGDLIHFGAQHGRTPEEVDAARRAFPQAPSRLSVTARAILARAAVQVPDVSEDREVADSLRIYRTVLAVPMMRDQRPVGAITVAREL
jgi:two-component system, NtrC family, sensor kinase